MEGEESGKMVVGRLTLPARHLIIRFESMDRNLEQQKQQPRQLHGHDEEALLISSSRKRSAALLPLFAPPTDRSFVRDAAR